MSRSAGTGSPVWFRCYRDRMGDYDERGHTVALTGRTRPYRPPRVLGSRSTFVSREYRCSCGFVGWSNHIDLARRAGDAEAIRASGRSA
jgi:hypothetical protein